MYYTLIIKKSIKPHFIKDNCLYDVNSLMELSKQEFEETRLTLNEIDKMLSNKNDN